MTGLPGAGKTQLARALAAAGLARLCPDEEMFKRHGRYGYDFPRGQFRVRERPILDDLAIELQKVLAAGRDTVFDHGFWTREDRAAWQDRAVAAGAEPLWVYLPVPHEVRWTRVRERNQHVHTDANSIEFSESDLLRLETRFQPPGEEEPHLVYDQRPATVLSALGLSHENAGPSSAAAHRPT